MDQPLAKSKCPPPPSHVFFKHFTRNLVIGCLITVVVILIGMLGYRHFEKSSWLDAYANAAMIISGVGTLTNPNTSEGKLFVATYSLFGGGLYLLVVAVVFSPIFHWFSRQIQMEDREHFR
jgi:high-affinity Fe2+/Pb2+ permease